MRCGFFENDKRRAHAVLVDLQVGDRDRQIVAVLQHQVRFGAQVRGHDHAGTSRIEVQRRPALLKKREEGLVF